MSERAKNRNDKGLDDGILAAKAACRALSLGEGGTTGRVVEGGLSPELGELKIRDWGLNGVAGTGVFGGTEGPAGLGEKPGKLYPL